jgi:hypothetical protein
MTRAAKGVTRSEATERPQRRGPPGSFNAKLAGTEGVGFAEKILAQREKRTEPAVIDCTNNAYSSSGPMVPKNVDSHLVLNARRTLHLLAAQIPIDLATQLIVRHSFESGQVGA